MTDEKRKFRRRKLILTLFHIIFVAMSVFGISAMYLNSNYGKGIPLNPGCHGVPGGAGV